MTRTATRYEYQVSASAEVDREYFSSAAQAKGYAVKLSKQMPEAEIYIDVYDNATDELTGTYYTVNQGKIVKHI